MNRAVTSVYRSTPSVRSALSTHPMNMNRKQEVVIKAPLLDGDNIPNIATTTDGHKRERAHTQNWNQHMAGGSRRETVCVR